MLYFPQFDTLDFEIPIQAGHQYPNLVIQGFPWIVAMDELNFNN